MSLTPNDFIAPTGKLQDNSFPAGDLLPNVIIWLNQAGTKLENIDAVFHEAAKTDWVYYRAYSHIADRLASEPDSAEVDDVKRTISKERIQYFQKLAEEHRQRYENYATPVVAPSAPRSVAVRNRAVF